MGLKWQNMEDWVPRDEAWLFDILFRATERRYDIRLSVADKFLLRKHLQKNLGFYTLSDMSADLLGFLERFGFDSVLLRDALEGRAEQFSEIAREKGPAQGPEGKP